MNIEISFAFVQGLVLGITLMGIISLIFFRSFYIAFKRELLKEAKD